MYTIAQEFGAQMQSMVEKDLESSTSILVVRGSFVAQLEIALPSHSVISSIPRCPTRLSTENVEMGALWLELD